MIIIGTDDFMILIGGEKEEDGEAENEIPHDASGIVLHILCLHALCVYV